MSFFFLDDEIREDLGGRDVFFGDGVYPPHTSGLPVRPAGREAPWAGRQEAGRRKRAHIWPA